MRIITDDTDLEIHTPIFRLEINIDDSWHDLSSFKVTFTNSEIPGVSDSTISFDIIALLKEHIRKARYNQKAREESPSDAFKA